MADELRGIVQRMVDAGEPEENIAAVIRAHTAPKPNSGVNKPIKSASTWGQGVMDSLTNGESAMAGLKGAGGFLKGALLDIPSTLIDSVKTVSKMPNPLSMGMTNVGGGITNPQDINDAWEGLKAAPGQMADTAAHAGSKPFEFGEMMGQITGQPLATEGLSMIPGATLAKGVRTVGKGVSKAGKFVENVKPASAMIPRMVEPRIAGMAEGAAGRGLTKIGDAMQKTGLPKILRSSDYGPVPFTPEAKLKSPTGSGKGSVSYPETNPYDPSVTFNSDYGPTDFTPSGPTTAPGGSNRGGMSYPELNETPPSLVPNSSAATDEFVNSVMAPGGEMRGGASYPETSMRPQGLMENSDYGPVDFTPDAPLQAPTGPNRGSVSYPETNAMDPSVTLNDQYGPVDFQPDAPLQSPTGPNKGSMSYPEMADTPPSLVPNSQAGMDEFVQSVMSPGGDMRGSMSYPEMNPMDPSVMHNSHYEPYQYTPPSKGGMEYSGPIEGQKINGPQEGIDYRVRRDLPVEEDWGWGANHPTEWIQKPRPAMEVLPPEVKNDMFGVPKNRDMTPLEVETAKRRIMAEESKYYGDSGELANATDEASGIIEGEVVKPNRPKLPPADPSFADQVTGMTDKLKNVDLDKVDNLATKGPEYHQRMMKAAGDGKPGFSVEGPTQKEWTPQGVKHTPIKGENHLIYRDEGGKPYAIAKVIDGPEGKMVTDISIDKLAGAGAKANATKSIIKELDKMDALRPYGGMTNDSKVAFARLLGMATRLRK